ncbi:MAG: hypothetical protein AAFW81_05875 [Pseudomonadota bacterium]
MVAKKTIFLLAWCAALAPGYAQAATCFNNDAVETKAGAATAVVGRNVGIRTENAGEFRRPDAGDDVFSGNFIRTGAASRLQLKMCDWSTYTFAPNSESSIDEFYDAEGASRRRVVNFVRGSMRLFSGRSAQSGATQVRFEEDGVTMGVRGTSVLIAEQPEGKLILLEGPALENSGLERPGEVDLVRDGGDDGVTLSRPGFAVTFGPTGFSEPFKPSPAVIRRAFASFDATAAEEDSANVETEDTGSEETSTQEEETASDESSGESAESGDGSATVAASSDSGVATQDAAQVVQVAVEQAASSSTSSDATPEQPSEPTDTFVGNFNDAFPSTLFPPIDDLDNVLTTGGLENFGATVEGGRGFFQGFAQARLFDGSSGTNVLVDTGVAFIQMHIDFTTREIWPEPALSFVTLDFSVGDVNDLTIDDPDFLQLFIRSIGAAVNTPFNTALGDLAVFRPNDTNLQFIVRSGTDANGNPTILLDAIAVFDESSGQTQQPGDVAEAEFEDLIFQLGQADFVRFGSPFSFISTISDLQNVNRPGSAFIVGDGFTGPFTLNRQNDFGFVNSISIAPTVIQFDVDFAARTIGGPQSFVFASLSPGSPFFTQTAVAFPGAEVFIPFTNAVPFSAGEFGLGFYPLNLFTSDPDLIAGQLIIRGEATDLETFVFAEFGAAVETDSGVDLLLLDFLNEEFVGPVALEAELLAQQGSGFYSGTGFASLFLSETGVNLDGFFDAEIDVDFDNRTIGGGNSFVQIVLDSDPMAVQTFTDFLQSVPFSRADSGFALFGLRNSDFSGDVIDEAIIALRNEAGVADTADIDFVFQRTGGDSGLGGGPLALNAGSASGPP